jgi:hypothetical protein
MSGKIETMKLVQVKIMRLIILKQRLYKEPKCRKCYTKYLSSAPTNIDVDGEQKPRCLLCMKISAADSMKMKKIKRHFEIVHAECVGKTFELFHRKLNEFKFEFFEVVTPCSVVVGYQSFRGPCCLLLQGEVGMKAAWTSEKRHHSEELNLKHYHPENLKTCINEFNKHKQAFAEIIILISKQLLASLKVACRISKCKKKKVIRMENG